jgi:hypothetical protein
VGDAVRAAASVLRAQHLGVYLLVNMLLSDRRSCSPMSSARHAWAPPAPSNGAARIAGHGKRARTGCDAGSILIDRFAGCTLPRQAAVPIRPGRYPPSA